MAVVVRARQEIHGAFRDATLVETAVEPRIGRTSRLLRRLPRRYTCLTFCSERRQPAVVGRYDQRRLHLRLAAILPVLGRVAARLRVGRRRFRELLGVRSGFLGGLPLPSRELLRCQRVARSEALGALQGHALPFRARPQSLKVGVPPRRLRRRPTCGCLTFPALLSIDAQRCKRRRQRPNRCREYSVHRKYPQWSVSTFRYWPYSFSSTNSTQRNSTSSAFASIRL